MAPGTSCSTPEERDHDTRSERIGERLPRPPHREGPLLGSGIHHDQRVAAVIRSGKATLAARGRLRRKKRARGVIRFITPRAGGLLTGESSCRAGDGIRTRDVQLGKLAFYP